MKVREKKSRTTIKENKKVRQPGFKVPSTKKD